MFSLNGLNLSHWLILKFYKSAFKQVITGKLEPVLLDAWFQTRLHTH